MKTKTNQLHEEVNEKNEKNVKMQQVKIENDQLHHQLVSRHQETNKISVYSQTIKVGIIVTDRSFEGKFTCVDF